MRHITTYQDKKVLVLGLGESGVNVAKLLHQLGAQVTVNDLKQFAADDPDIVALRKLGIEVITGHHPTALLDDGFQYLVKDPGIRYDNPMIVKAAANHIPVISEPEVAFEASSAPWIGITGTNGKTTTTTMIELMLNDHRKCGHAYADGNIGVSASKVVQKATADDVMVTELSSFQLQGTIKLRPHIAVITNIYSTHLDYHGDRAHYIAAKMKITANQTADDYLVINWDKAEWRDLSKQTQAQVIPFSAQDLNEDGAYLKNGTLYFKGEPIIKADAIKVPGEQNIENALAAIAVAKLMGQDNQAIVDVLTTFPGVKHRVQFVAEYQQRRFYNDSKATNITATQVALRSFKQPVILLAGGLDRGNGFDDLIPSLREHVKAIVLFGQTADKIAAAARKAGVKTIKFAERAGAAVPLAYQLSAPGDVILLSPACASWDQYSHFEVRGDEFIDAVHHLIAKQGGKPCE